MSNLSDRGTLRGTLQRTIRNYNDLINKPAINGRTLVGNQSGHALGLANMDDIINVEANPLGSATADLHKILVDDTIYSIPDVVVYGTASGAIASFDDGGNDKPLKSLKVAINPVQEGSEDPSPSNVRPISGWDEANVTRCGKNLFDKTTITENKIINNNTGKETASYGRFSSDYIKVNPSTNYYASNVIKSAQWYCAFYYDNNKNYLSCGELSSTGNIASGVITTPSNCNYVRLVSLTAYKDDVSFVVGNQAPTTYEPYNSTTYPITWSEAGEVFGGTLDVTNGKLKARPYYASYNGETLIGPWVSSMDVYDPNTTPTTGAQVVDLGGVETVIDISPTQITTLLGNNNIWSDTGEIEECIYQRDINIAINKALSQ